MSTTGNSDRTGRSLGVLGSPRHHIPGVSEKCSEVRGKFEGYSTSPGGTNERRGSILERQVWRFYCKMELDHLLGHPINNTLENYFVSEEINVSSYVQLLLR